MPVLSGGSLARTEATGYGLCYLTDEMLREHGKSFEGKTVVISGSGNVAIYATQKATALGAKVVALSDSDGYIYDKNGINLPVVQQIKEVERGRIKEYAARVPGSVYTEGCRGIWSIKCDIALPSATQNELDAAGAAALIANGVIAVAEGANMPTTPGGGRAAPNPRACCSHPRKRRTRAASQPPDLKCRRIPSGCPGRSRKSTRNCTTSCATYTETSPPPQRNSAARATLVAGANIAGFLKVADAMLWQGICY